MRRQEDSRCKKEGSREVGDFAFADTSYMNVGGNLYYVSFMYRNSVLNSGERNAYGNGAQFALHGKDWNPAYFDASDDPSHRGLGREFAVADSIVVLDGNGNLLWGHVPQPKFANNFVVMPAGESRVTRVGDVVYVDIDETGYYMKTRNGVPLKFVRKLERTHTACRTEELLPTNAMAKYTDIRQSVTRYGWLRI